MKNPRIQRWAIILGEYACKIEYISGPKNAAADMLSRLHDTPVAGDLDENCYLDWQGGEACINVIDNAAQISSESETDPKQKEIEPLYYQTFDEKALKNAQKEGEEIRNIIDKLESQDTEPQVASYIIENGLLYHLEKGTKTRPHTRMQLVIPPIHRK